MSDFKAKMHQIPFRLGLRPRPRWGSLQHSPSSPSWYLRGLLLWEGKGKEGGRGGKDGKSKEGGGEGRKGKGGALGVPPNFEILATPLSDRSSFKKFLLGDIV